MNSLPRGILSSNSSNFEAIDRHIRDTGFNFGFGNVKFDKIMSM